MSTPIQRSASHPPPAMVPLHPPAQKVGGRRMSLSSRPNKPHVPAEQKNAASAEDDTPADYPRPAAPGQQPPHEEHHRHEDEQPKRDQKNVEHERKVQETLHKKAEQNRPSKEPFAKAPVARVIQPARQLNL